ncbi:MAG TPA: GTPase ObgE [bacterium]
MKFIDEAKIYLKAGDGGNGCISFRREKYVPRGGPDGGNGGNGGNIILKADDSLNTLIDFKYKRHYRAKNGEHGRGKDQYGKNGPDLVIKVPCGTIVKNADTGNVIVDLEKNGTVFVIAKSGKGGRGNTSFTTSVRRAPRIAEKGQEGDELWIKLELHLIADVGIMGMPNVGKSTLISKISAAKPKVADYPFTTLAPNLGVVKFGDFASFVMADMPGLIEGAHDGTGLGITFLKHIERARVLLHLVTLQDEDADAVENYNLLRKEMQMYKDTLLGKTEIVALNKIDQPWIREKFPGIKENFEKIGIKVYPISAVNGEGVDKLIHAIVNVLGETEARR